MFQGKPKHITLPLITICILIFMSAVCHATETTEKVTDNPSKKLVILPFENFTGMKEAVPLVMPVVTYILEQNGMDIADSQALDSFLCDKRVRSTGYVPEDLAREIGEKFRVDHILVGSVISFSPGENPKFGIAARLINTSDGSIIWADYSSATGDDFTGILGLGKVQEMSDLVLKIVDRLFLSFSTRPPDKEIESTYKIAVMPFLNKSKFRNGGMIAMYLFLTGFFKNEGFVPIEFGGIRKSIVENTVRYSGELDYENIQRISESLGADVILVGTVDDYSAGSQRSSPPEVSITARLLDARKNRVLWFNKYRMNGKDDIIVLDWREIRSVDKVAYRVVSKLIRNIETSTWY
jgi:TolB-like protein